MRRTIAIVGGSLVLAMLLVATAFAAEVSRDEYKEAAEPICKTSAKATEQILAPARRQVSKGQLKQAAAEFAKASRQQAQALRKLEALPRPVADEARLNRWFKYLGVEAKLFAVAGKKLKAGDKPRAERIISKLVHNVNRANVQVLPFSFRYCRLNAAKFS